jgi:hypothetical protein
MNTLDIGILIYGYAFSVLLIYLIDHGLVRQYRLIGIGIAIFIFLCYLFFLNNEQYANLNYGFLTLPIIATLVFNFAEFLSWKLSKREFRATWQGARYFGTEKKNWIDYFLSFFVILIVFCWPMLIVIILNKKI